MTKIYFQSFLPKKTSTCTKTIINRFCFSKRHRSVLHESLGIVFTCLYFNIYGQRYTSTWYNIDNGLPQSSAKAIVRISMALSGSPLKTDLYGTTGVPSLRSIISESTIFTLVNLLVMLLRTTLQFLMISRRTRLLLKTGSQS